MSAPAFRNVALLGATGNLGKHILSQLNKAGFKVTAIQRAESTNTAQGAANAVKVDLSNQDALADAFKGIDVVVSSVPNPTLKGEKPWIDAAIQAGVKRIVPSEYSTNIETENSRKLPIVKDKVEIRKYVEEVASQGKIDWTSVNGGPFFVPFIWTGGWAAVNVKEKSVILYDGGERIVCSSTLDRIGETVAAVLLPENAEATKNQPVYTYSAPISAKKIQGVVEKITGGKLKEKPASITELTKPIYEAIEKGDHSKNMGLYIPFMWGEGYGGDFRNLGWNEKLGLKEMTDKEMEETIAQWIK